MSIIVRENEEKIKEIREHKLVLVPRFVFWIAVIILLGVWDSPQFVLIGVAIVAFLSLLIKIFRWEYTMLVLTNQRIVCQVQKGLFSRNTIELLYKDIKELSYANRGIGGTMFNYGDLKLSTAADVTHTFEHIPEPDHVVELIGKMR
ncbi:MAG: PH domain-containing protein [Patescibacteria group bacterium]